MKAVFKMEIIVMLVLCYLSIRCKAHPVEPQCSKFPYEEALLEKMVRMEFNVQKMSEGIKDVEDKVKEELTKLQAERQSIVDERSDFGVQLRRVESDAAVNIKKLTDDNEAKINTLKTNVEESLEHTETVINRMSTDLTDLKNNTIQDLIDKTRRPSILFRARELQDHSPSNNQILVFQTVMENEGDGYNKDTGVFTAPHDGEYLFTAQLCLYGTREFVFQFMQDGDMKLTAEFHNGGDGCSTAVYMTKISAQTQIWLKSASSYGNDALYSDLDRWNMFSGILIK